MARLGPTRRASVRHGAVRALEHNGLAGRAAPRPDRGAVHALRVNQRRPLPSHKRIALRADKTGQSFGAMIYLAAAVINSR